MKRYTGQQALYEAISRSRAKAKQASILEKLRPEPPQPDDPAAPSQPPMEPEQTPAPIQEPAAQEPIEPQAVETPQPVVEEQAQPVPVELPPEPASEVSPEPVDQFEPTVWSRPAERVLHPASPSPVKTWLRPRPVQLNEGRIEISVPYYVGVIAGLVILVVVLTAYRIGQGRSNGQVADAAGKQVQPGTDGSGARPNPPMGTSPQNTTATDTGRPQSNPGSPTATRQGAAVAASQGDHWLVLATSKQESDFEPVVRHFAEHGIKLGVVSFSALREHLTKVGLNPGVVPSGDGFLLVTYDALENPNVPGTDGYKMKQKITEVGALYKGKAPAGYESFAPNYFRDAYPMKIR